MPREEKFCAFISYKKGGIDEAFAREIQNIIEKYRIPHKIRKDLNCAPRLGKVFLDSTDLGMSGSLTADILSALDYSSSMILICSKRSRESEWVKKEVDYFIKNGKENRIYCIVLDGDIENPYPGLIQSKDKISINMSVPFNVESTVKFSKASISGQVKRNKIKIISSVIGVNYGEMVDRIARQERRRYIFGIVSSLSLALIFSVLSVYSYLQRIEALQQRERARAEQERAEIANRYFNDLSFKIIRKSPEAIQIAKDILSDDMEMAKVVLKNLIKSSDLAKDPETRRNLNDLVANISEKDIVNKLLDVLGPERMGQDFLDSAKEASQKAVVANNKKSDSDIDHSIEEIQLQIKRAKETKTIGVLPALYFNLERLFFTKKDYLNAMSAIDAGLLFDSDKEDKIMGYLYRDKGRILLMQKKYKDSYIAFDMAIKKGDTRGMTYIFAGESLYSMNKYKESIKFYEKSKEMPLDDSGNDVVKMADYRISFAYIKLKKCELAKKYINSSKNKEEILNELQDSLLKCR